MSYSFPYDYDDKYLNQTKINKSFTSLTFFCSQSFSFNNWNLLRKVVFFTKNIRGETFFPLLYREIFSPSWCENVIKKTGKVWTSSQMETRRQTTMYVIFHIAGECTIWNIKSYLTFVGHLRQFRSESASFVCPWHLITRHLANVYQIWCF